MSTQVSAHGARQQAGEGGWGTNGPPNSWLQASIHINYGLLVLTGRQFESTKRQKFTAQVCVYLRHSASNVITLYR